RPSAPARARVPRPAPRDIDGALRADRVQLRRARPRGHGGERASAGRGGRKVSLLVRRSDTSEFRKRFRWIGLAMVLAFLGLIARLFVLQVLEAEENRAIARENIIRRVTLATTRGMILDKN